MSDVGVTGVVVGRRPPEGGGGGEPVPDGPRPGIKDVRDYGATGDGSTDDIAAIMRAVDDTEAPYSDTARGTIYFSGGRYKISEPIELPTNIRAFSLVGSPGTTIEGNFEGPLVNRPQESPYGGTYGVEFLQFKNSHPRGKDMVMHSCVAVAIRNCTFGAHIGLETFNSQAATIDTCVFIRDGGTQLEGSVGVRAGNATSLFNCDVTGYEDGVQHQNLGMCIIGGRYEVNGRAIVLGLGETGEVFQSTGAKISGLSMESNGHGIYLLSAASVQIDGCAITCNVAGKQSGIYVHNAEEVNIVACGVSSGHPFSDAGIYLGNPQQCSFGALRINVSGGLAWRMPEDPGSRNLFFAANLPPAPGA